MKNTFYKKSLALSSLDLLSLNPLQIFENQILSTCLVVCSLRLFIQGLVNFPLKKENAYGN